MQIAHRDSLDQQHHATRIHLVLGGGGSEESHRLLLSVEFIPGFNSKFTTPSLAELITKEHPVEKGRVLGAIRERKEVRVIATRSTWSLCRWTVPWAVVSSGMAV